MKTQIDYENSNIIIDHSADKYIWDRKKRVNSLKIYVKSCEAEVTDSYWYLGIIIYKNGT